MKPWTASVALKVEPPELLLRAVEADEGLWDELLPESSRQWQYYADLWDDGSSAGGGLARFPADSDPQHSNVLGFYWDADTDTWVPWGRADYVVFLPGEMWGDVIDVDAAKAEVRRFCAQAREQWGHL